ncbi:MAG: GspE/PulE family protein [Verrucomicrobia bacterium]|nr:GspE/PulE family protein [Verrucomicrobiota bacterium]MBU4292042.1 GspE/PulE family protein [Verrucomicrobiota bacterium]MBU4427930.1 GspE/PulE family protein [Verrucomicrobiota bacterium]MCG2678876.1 GspE/PulE family protein [Kiritimatiellia bacterium]
MDEVTNQDPLLQLLKDNGALTPEQVADVCEEQARTGNSIHKIISDTGVIREDDLLVMIANHLGTTIVNLKEMDIQPTVIQTIPASVARMYNVVPIASKANSIVLATSQFPTLEVMDEIRFVLTRDISFVMAREEDIKNLIGRFFSNDNASINDMLSALELEFEQGMELQITEGKEADETGLEQAANSAPVVRFVNLILYEAVQSKASDIHFEPFEKEFKIRYRVDGALYEMQPPPRSLALPVISRIKVMAGMNIAERRLPQDNRIQMNLVGRPIDFRVSTLPTQFGESVVLRILDRSTVSLELENLGMPPDVYDAFVKDVQKPNGIVVVTGPTGSGKTTTLYSALRRINTVEAKLLTCEDPVEYDIEGIIQVPVNEVVGVTFSRILRHFLRQDPDIIMIGEIRDPETAQIAIQSSLTGHLVLTTLHTNDSAGAITRLIDMNIEPFLISSTLEAVMAQRLVRVICTKCKTPYQPDKPILEQLSLKEESVGDRSFYYGKGCPECHDAGYRGRKGLYECLAMTDAIRVLINQRKPTLEIRNKAIEQGMRLLRDDGLRNIFDGYTTVDEVLRYT